MNRKSQNQILDSLIYRSKIASFNNIEKICFNLLFIENKGAWANYMSINLFAIMPYNIEFCKDYKFVEKAGLKIYV